MEEGDFSPAASWILFIAGLLIGGVFALNFAVSITTQISTENWDEITGTITYLHEWESCDDEGCTTGQDIEYVYLPDQEKWPADNEEIWSERVTYAWLGPPYNGQSGELNEGDVIPVYVDPMNPYNSVLLKGMDGVDIFTIFIPIMIIIVTIISWKRVSKVPFNEAFENIGSGIENNGFHDENYIRTPKIGIVGANSRERGYNSVINRLNLHSLQKDEQAIKERMIHKFNFTPTQAESFIQSEHVRLTLQLDAPPPMPPLSDGMMQYPVQNKEKENNDQLDMMAVFASAMEENLGVDSPDSFEPKPLSSGMPYCEHPGCNVTVSNTDFRCFKCRRTFCYDHKGTSVVCPECS